MLGLQSQQFDVPVGPLTTNGWNLAPKPLGCPRISTKFRNAYLSHPDLAMKFTDEMDKIRIFDLSFVRVSQELGKTDRR